MNDNSRLACVIAAAGAFVFTSPAEPRTKQPKISARCLAPGSSRPVACGASQAGSDLELVVTGQLADAPRLLVFRQVGADREVRLQPKWFLDQASVVKTRAPASQLLCPAGAKGQQLQFEIQMATSDMNQARSGTADSLGYFQMRC